jgi:hypothetical protein
MSIDRALRAAGEEPPAGAPEDKPQQAAPAGH